MTRDVNKIADKIAECQIMNGCTDTLEWLLSDCSKQGATDEDIADALEIAIKRLRQQANTLETFRANAVEALGIERKA